MLRHSLVEQTLVFCTMQCKVVFFVPSIFRHLKNPLSASFAMLAHHTAFQAPRRRPRRHPYPSSVAVTPIVAPLPAYVLPPPVLLAVATLSLAALRHVFSKSPNLSLRALVETLQKNVRMLLPRRPASPSPSPLNMLDHASRLDALRDRSIAEIDALQPVPEDYSSLAPIQRRALLQSALERAYHSPPSPPTRTQSTTRIAVEDTKVVTNAPGGVASKFWSAAEQVNGRLAALGFVLCLAREVAEPGHPSLFEQVVDVVVPIAQKTPPFLVAVVDRLVDLVT